MRAQDRRVPCQVVKVVHDDGDEEIEHEEGAEEDEGDEVGVGERGTARLGDELARGQVAGERLRVARPAGLAGEHDARPGLAGGAPSSDWPEVSL